jgi:hypothetical protein
VNCGADEYRCAGQQRAHFGGDKGKRQGCEGDNTTTRASERDQDLAHVVEFLASDVGKRKPAPEGEYGQWELESSSDFDFSLMSELDDLDVLGFDSFDEDNDWQQVEGEGEQGSASRQEQEQRSYADVVKS